MHRAIALLASLLLGACGPEKIDRLEIYGLELKVAVDAQGKGQYQRGVGNEGRNGSFTISPDQFANLLKQLQPYQSDPETTTRDGLTALINKACPHPYVTDQGGFYVHWVGRNIDQHYWVDLGCDPVGNATRNTKIRALLNSLPPPSGA
jgi:hypothetical protein